MGLLFAVFMVTVRPALGATITVSAVGGGGVLPGDSVPIRVTSTLGATETIDTQDLQLDIIGVQSYQFVVPIAATGAIDTLRSGAGVLRGTVTQNHIVVGASTISTDGNVATITFNGTFTVPFNAPAGNYVVQARLQGSSTFQGSSQFTVLEEPSSSATPTPSGPAVSSPKVRMAINTAPQVPSGQILSDLQSQVQAALGSSNIKMLGGGSPLVSGSNGIVMQLPGLNITQGMSVSGPIDISAPDIELSTTNGTGTVTLHLGDGITLQADATIVPQANRLDVQLSNVHITFTPASPDVSLLTGGDPSVTALGASFDAKVVALPDGSALDLSFAKDPSAFFSNPGTVFDQAAQSLGGVIGDPSTDVAFSVDVTKEQITNSDLGDNTVTLLVSSDWYNARSSENKTFAILKQDGAGNIHATAAQCTPTSGNMVSCTATLTGDAGGFSTFALFAVSPPPTPTATPTSTAQPTVTATPTVQSASPTPTPAPPGGGGGNTLLIIVIAVVVVLAVGGGAFFLMRRRPAGV